MAKGQKKKKGNGWAKALLFGIVFVILTIASDFFDQVWLNFGLLWLIVLAVCLFLFFAVIYHFGFKSSM